MSDVDKSEPSEKETPIEPVLSMDGESSNSSMTLWQEFCFLLRHDRKWWIVPILMSLALIAIAVVFQASTSLPFIYRLQ